MIINLSHIGEGSRDFYQIQLKTAKEIAFLSHRLLPHQNAEEVSVKKKAKIEKRGRG